MRLKMFYHRRIPFLWKIKTKIKRYREQLWVPSHKGEGSQGTVPETLSSGQYRYLRGKKLVRWALEGSPL